MSVAKATDTIVQRPSRLSKAPAWISRWRYASFFGWTPTANSEQTEAVNVPINRRWTDQFIECQVSNVAWFSRRRYGDEGIFRADVPSAAKRHMTLVL